jgi:lipoprotein-releasing system ATP-binding protein
MYLFVDAKNLSKQFTGQEDGNHTSVFADLNFEVEAETTLALVGPSGSGKSTLLNLISGLDNPSGGNILVDGKDVHAMNADQSACFRNQTLGFIFQSHHLMPALSALENVMLPALAGHGLLEGKELEDRATKLLEDVGLLKRAKHVPSQLSGGEKQRVAVARALINQPKLLLADEPTGALDQVNAENLINLLLEVCHKNRTTMIMVTHAHSLADKMQSKWNFDRGTLKKERA